ncbi:hypothetical protein BMC34_003182 [Escherichia coli]|nr:hypothetical protein [Escherichia coli]EFG8127761.1 hypothetical protein [Escherichia coli]EKQ5569681.1 hypothetical protein [Escherichia coli]
MVDLFCCTGAIARQVPEAGSEVLSRVIASGCAVLTWVLVAGDEILSRKWLRIDSSSDPLSARVVAALAHFLSSVFSCPAAGFRTEW